MVAAHVTGHVLEGHLMTRQLLVSDFTALLAGSCTALLLESCTALIAAISNAYVAVSKILDALRSVI